MVWWWSRGGGNKKVKLKVTNSTLHYTHCTHAETGFCQAVVVVVVIALQQRLNAYLLFSKTHCKGM